MKNFIEYELDDNITILIQAPDDIGGVVKASRSDWHLTKAKKTFREALSEAKLQANILLEEIEDLHIQEAEIKFGLTTVGEIGNLAIGKVGVDINYEVTLKWKSTKTIS